MNAHSKWESKKPTQRRNMLVSTAVQIPLQASQISKDRQEEKTTSKGSDCTSRPLQDILNYYVLLHNKKDEC